MTIKLLTDARVAELRTQPLTYPEVGRSLGTPPEGYRHISRTHAMGSTADFDELAHALLTWQVQTRSGLRIATSALEIEPEAVIEMRLGIGAAGFTIPCRVVAVIDEPDRRGFAYGTLPGHPERGEEAFVLHRRADGAIDFTISAFSRPATALARLGGPGTVLVQRLMTSRYLRALD